MKKNINQGTIGRQALCDGHIIGMENITQKVHVYLGVFENRFFGFSTTRGNWTADWYLNLHF